MICPKHEDSCHMENQRVIKTNFDVCCESAEKMAQIIDIMKCGWSNEQILEWLNRPADNDIQGGMKIMSMCVMNGPCPFQTRMNEIGLDECVMDKGACEYKMLANAVEG